MNATGIDKSEKSQRQLAAGVLKQATQDLRRFHGAPSQIEQELYFDAYSWVMSDDRCWPFSFLNVCRFLDLALADVRHELLGDLSLGVFNQRVRRCSWAAGRLQRLLAQRFASERNVFVAKPVGSVHTVH
jgi:hypothetical protein